MAIMRERFPDQYEPHMLRAGKVASSSAITTVETFLVAGEDHFLCLGVAAIDHNHVIPSWVEIGVLDGTAKIPVRCQFGPFPAHTSANIHYPFIVAKGQKLYATFNKPWAKDNLELIAHGVMLDGDLLEKRSRGNNCILGRRWDYYGWR